LHIDNIIIIKITVLLPQSYASLDNVGYPDYACWFSFFQQYFSYIMAVSFIGGRNRSTRRKPQICRKSLTNFIT